MRKQLTVNEVLNKFIESGEFKPFSGYVSINQAEPSMFQGYVGINNQFIIDKFKDNVFNDIYLYSNECWINVPEEYEPYPDNMCPPLNCGDVICCKNFKCLITAIDEDTRKHIRTDGWFTNKELFENYTMPDGTPIGRIKEV